MNIQVFWDVILIDQSSSVTSQKTLIFILQIFFLYIDFCRSLRYPHITVIRRQLQKLVFFSCFCVRRLSITVYITWTIKYVFCRGNSLFEGPLFSVPCLVAIYISGVHCQDSWFNCSRIIDFIIRCLALEDILKLDLKWAEVTAEWKNVQ
jgi:hypothetical protein